MNLVCIHGNSLDSSIFDFISVDGVRKITIDLPGHGIEPISGTSSFLDLVEFVYSKIKHLDDIILFGSSLGGHIAYHLLSKITPLAIVTISSPPLNLDTVGIAFLPNTLGQLLFTANINPNDAQALAQSMLSLENKFTPNLTQMILNTDPRIREIIGQSLLRGEFLDELSLIKSFDGKKILIVPTDESMANKDYIKSISFADTLEIEGNHILTLDNSFELNKVLSRMIKELRA